MPLQLVSFVPTPGQGGATAYVGFMSGKYVVGFERVKQACAGVRAQCDLPGCWSSPLAVIQHGACFEAAKGYADWFAAQDPRTQSELGAPLDQVKLLPPVAAPGKVFCLAQNFPSHIGETRNIMHAKKGEVLCGQSTPKVFLKPTPNTICGPGDPIIIGRRAQFIDYEAEICAVIGETCKYVDPEYAMEYVAAVTCMNDVSERQIKLWERDVAGEWDKFFDWLNGKWMDSFAPMGPCLVSTRELDVENLALRCYVNDDLRQDDNTCTMIHSISQTVSYISQMLTLEPGDVIAMGTPGGVGKARGIKLEPGDVVTVEIEGIGRLSNPVVAESE